MHNFMLKKKKFYAILFFLDILILFHEKLVKNLNITKINYQ